MRYSLKYFRVYLLITLLSAFGLDAFSQTVTGLVRDSLKAPISYAPVALLNASDSIYKGALTDDNGRFVFENVKQGTYRVKVMATGYREKFSALFSSDSSGSVEVPAIMLGAQEVSLDEVSVTVMKKPIEFKNGNITVNIEGSPLAVGNTVYDLLLRLPGVTVIDNVISIQNNGSAKVFIDGRQQRLSGTQLINLLKGMSASAIEKIEVIKNPSVKYDASGTAGIIEIKTKRLKITGFSGNVNSTYIQAFQGNGLLSAELNYKGKKVNFFSGLAGIDESYHKENHYDRHITYKGNTSDVNQVYYEREHSRFFYGNVGADWYINDKNTIGFKINDAGGIGYYDRTGNVTISNSDVGYNYSDYGFHKDNPFNYTEANINAEHRFDTLGTKLIFSGDYTYNYDLYAGDFFQNFYDYINFTPQTKRKYRSNNEIDLTIYSAKLDFEKQFSKNLKLEAGLKGTNQELYSTYFFANRNDTSGEYIRDTALSNTFHYYEQVSAAYLNLSRTIKKFSLQAGLRGEQTNIHTLIESNMSGIKRSYFNLFPVASIDYNPNETHSWQLSLNRRIDRPDYNSFNPYRTFRNLLSSDAGNPYLSPMYTTSFSFSHTYKGRISNSISLNRVHNLIFPLPQQNDSSKVVVTYLYNMNRKDVLAYNLFIQQDIRKWWSTTVFASATYFTYSGIVLGSNYKVTSYSYYAGVNNQFLFSKTFKAELNAIYFAPWLNGIGLMKSRWGLDVAIKKTYLDDKLTLSVGCSDIFFTMIFRNEVHYANLDATSRHTNDTRRLRFSISYNFGKLKVNQRQIRSNEDESRRLGK